MEDLFSPSSEEQRDQLGGAPGAEESDQSAGQTQTPESYAPTPLTDYQGYSESDEQREQLANALGTDHKTTIKAQGKPRTLRVTRQFQ